MRKFFIFTAFLLITLSLNAKKLTTEQYIAKYDVYAINNMKKYGIPASITLAQGLLESNCGNSRLATEGNNHFGIKCSDWRGKTMYQDDDQKNECFRVYDSAKDSYDDHSSFLRNKDRYAFLFKYKSTDYKSWAYGLKKAGYATNPHYPARLIKIIEDNNLHRFDLGNAAIGPTHLKKINNGVYYIRSKPGDSFESINQEFKLKDWELAYYNDLPQDYTLTPNTILYLNPKRSKAAKGYESHMIQAGESVWYISQVYGIKLSKLVKYNKIPNNYQAQVGDILWLRRSKN